MNSVPTITAGSITAMTGLSKRPVYFLRLNGAAQPNLVVKGEASAHPGISNPDALVSISWGSKMMKNVNNTQVNTKHMTANEVAVFRAAGNAMFAGGSPQQLNLTQNYKWVKMPMVPGLSDAEIYDDSSNPDTLAVKRNVVKFLDDAVWHDLGVVVAVDIFNGNSDRFDISSGFWQNKGNVMFLTVGTTAVIGLDTFDPNSLDKGNLASKGGFPELKILTDQAQRDAFALKCTQSVGKELSKVAKAGAMGNFVAKVPGLSNAMISFQVDNIKRLYEAYAPIFSSGIGDGATALKAYLQGKVQQYTPPRGWQNANPGQRRGITMGAGRTLQPTKSLPQGVKDRMAYLGW